jgi:hypothetical protein
MGAGHEARMGERKAKKKMARKTQNKNRSGQLDKMGEYY